MGRFKDIAGQRFGNLIALERTELKKHSSSIWRCICDCGNETLVPINYLNCGDTTSCGCNKWKGNPKDVKGQRFNKLTALYRTEDKGVSGDFLWMCECDCGTKVQVPIGRLQSGSSYSCGCEDRRGKHNMCGTPTYRSWVKMLQRCRTDDYGEWYEDVTVCPEWDTEQGGSFENFLADMGERPEGCTLNRVRSARIYSKETCEWANASVQGFDQRRSKRNTSGRTGVRWREEREVWEARICFEGQQILLYYGASFEEAVKCREEAELKYYGFTKE